MKKADFNKLLSKLPQGKTRWTYDNSGGYDLSVYAESKVHGFLFCHLYKTLHVTIHNMQGECLALDVFILSSAQADALYDLFLEK